VVDVSTRDVDVPTGRTKTKRSGSPDHARATKDQSTGHR